MRVFLRILPTLALVLALFTPARVARAAPPAEAAAAFDEGIGHYRRKAFTEAAEAFHRAYRIQPSADAAYNTGLAWELSGRLGLAATAYQVALELELEPTAAADARAHRRMAKDLCRVEVSGPEGTRSPRTARRRRSPRGAVPRGRAPDAADHAPERGATHTRRGRGRRHHECAPDRRHRAPGPGSAKSRARPVRSPNPNQQERAIASPGSSR
ncbi:MAG: hypothetical protein U0263_14225 [Polyangiaceae bacterium]